MSNIEEKARGRPVFAGFKEGEREPEVKCTRPLEAGKEKETDFPQEPSNRNVTLADIRF